MPLPPFRYTQIFFVALLLLMTLLMSLTEEQTNLLRFDRQAIIAGEWWRLLSANVIHLGWGHLLMNAAGAVLILLFFGNCLSAAGWLLGAVFCSLFIALTILGLHPEINWYIGLSGTLHGLFVLGGLADLKVRPLEAKLFLALIALKLAWEQFSGALPGSEQLAGGPVLTEAHLYGAIAGLVFWPLLRKLSCH